MKEVKNCIKCGNIRVMYSGGMCQICYRKHLKNKKENGIYIQKEPIKNKIANEIIDLFLNYNLSRKDIYIIIHTKYKKYKYRYICSVIKKYTTLEINGGEV